MTISTFLAGFFVALVQGAEPAGPKITAKLIPAHEAVAPGGKTQLAIQVDIEKPWHIYHSIVLEGAGLPTKFEFTAPAGVHFGEVRFPKPKIAEFQGAEFLGYEERATFLAEVSIDPTVPAGRPLEIGVTVSGLTCHLQCVIFETAASLKLPVAATMGAARDEKLFDGARGELAASFENAPYIKGTGVAVSHEKIPVGGKGELAVVIKVAPKHHMQDPDPGVDGLIGARLFLESIDGVQLDEPRWPAPKIRNVPELGKVREQSGAVAVRIPYTISDAKFEPRSVRLRALLHYQVCNDSGTCFPPEFAEGEFRFDVVAAGAPAVATGNALFTAPLPPQRAAIAKEGDKPAAALSTARPASTGAAGVSPVWVFFAAFLGGMILNVMPCVLPVLSLKIFSFMQQARDERDRVFKMGLVYAAGVLASFFVLAIIMIKLDVPWGGLMQRPEYVIGMSAVAFAFALSLLGVFELRLPGVVENVAGAVTTREGYGGAFLNGLMATALATPCVGPFLGTAMGILVQLPPLVRGAGIMTVGVGLALPFVLLSAFPGWLRYVPKPGTWMVTFKELMGFVLMATVIWLLWVLAALISAEQLVATLALLLAVGMACWMIGSISLSATRTRAIGTWVSAVAVIVVGFGAFQWLGGGSLAPAPSSGAVAGSGGSGSVTWQPWKKGRAEELAAEGFTVYVDFTAKWCLTCQTNKKVVLHSEAVEKRFTDLNVITLLADFTRYDEDIKQELRKHNRAGVPLNLILPAGKPDEPIVLPELLTTDIVLTALEKSGPSQKKRELAAGN